MNSSLMGQRIRVLRKKKGITQDELAKMLDVTPQAVSKWERGLSFPAIPLLPLLADQLDCNIDVLLREEESVVDETPAPVQQTGDPRELQCLYLQALCKACTMEGNVEFELGRYESALMAYTRGLRGLESFLTPGEEGLAAYPWLELIPLHWQLYLYRAVCYEHLMRRDDCKREVELAKTIEALAGELCGNSDGQETSFYQNMMELGLSGGTDSSFLRKKLLKKLDLPEHMSSNAMLQALNVLYTKEELGQIVKSISMER